MNPKFIQYGERSVLVEFGDYPTQYLSQIADAFPKATVRPGLKTVLLTFPESGNYEEEVRNSFPTFTEVLAENSSKTILIPITYDGEDLAVASEAAGVSVERLIALHQETNWKVALIGFAPGFPYLVPEQNQEIFHKISRLAAPRTKVPKGSVGLAAGMSCIYPSSSPGGWHLIGTTNVTMFDASKNPPNLLNVGDIVRFEALK